VGTTDLGVKVGVASLRNKLALLTGLRNPNQKYKPTESKSEIKGYGKSEIPILYLLNLKSQFSIL